MVQLNGIKEDMERILIEKWEIIVTSSQDIEGEITTFEILLISCRTCRHIFLVIRRMGSHSKNSASQLSSNNNISISLITSYNTNYSRSSVKLHLNNESFRIPKHSCPCKYKINYKTRLCDS